MPKVSIGQSMSECKKGDNLLKVLLKAGFEVYNGKAKNLNCKGLGTCGTCSVLVSGILSPMNDKEQLRLSLPPHRLKSGLRLACQCTIEGDISVRKLNGFWGQNE